MSRIIIPASHATPVLARSGGAQELCRFVLTQQVRWIDGQFEQRRVSNSAVDLRQHGAYAPRSARPYDTRGVIRWRPRHGGERGGRRCYRVRWRELRAGMGWQPIGASNRRYVTPLAVRVALIASAILLSSQASAGQTATASLTR